MCANDLFFRCKQLTSSYRTWSSPSMPTRAVHGSSSLISRSCPTCYGKYSLHLHHPFPCIHPYRSPRNSPVLMICVRLHRSARLGFRVRVKLFARSFQLRRTPTESFGRCSHLPISSASLQEQSQAGSQQCQPSGACFDPTLMVIHGSAPHIPTINHAARPSDFTFGYGQSPNSATLEVAFSQETSLALYYTSLVSPVSSIKP